MSFFESLTKACNDFTAATTAGYNHGVAQYNYESAIQADANQTAVVKPADLEETVAIAISKSTVIYETVKDFFLSIYDQIKGWFATDDADGRTVMGRVMDFCKKIANFIVENMEKGAAYVIESSAKFMKDYPNLAKLFAFDVFVKSTIAKSTHVDSNTAAATIL